MDGYVFSSHTMRRRETLFAVPAANDITARIAMTPAVLTQAYKIRHDGYLSYGYITPRDEGLFSDAYDGAKNERTIVIYRGDIAAATIRICLYDPSGFWPEADHLPAMEIFHDEVLALQDEAIGAGRLGRIIEITRFARAPSFANDRGLIIAAFRIVAYLRLYFDADIMINAVRPHHMPMYRRLGFEKIEEPRKYPNLTYCAGLMAMFRNRYDTALQKIGFPKGVSTHDPLYAPLISGNLVPVFPAFDEMQAEAVPERPVSAPVSMNLSQTLVDGRRLVM